MDEIKNATLCDEQLNDVSGGINVGDISIPVNLTPPGVNPADAVNNAVKQLAVSMSQAMQDAVEAQQGDVLKNKLRDTLGVE